MGRLTGQSPCREPDQLAYWFFRLNGCLTIVNFVVHPDLVRHNEPRSQRTDADILAVRFPHRRELLTSDDAMCDHQVFDSDSEIDLIIAEVKASECRLNGPWTEPKLENIQRVLYAIGAFPEEAVPTVAQALYEGKIYHDGQFRTRLMAIGSTTNPDLIDAAVQLTWNEILSFIYERISTYRRHKAQHEQWDPCGKWLYSRVTSLTEENFRREILQNMGIRSRS